MKREKTTRKTHNEGRGTEEGKAGEKSRDDVFASDEHEELLCRFFPFSGTPRSPFVSRIISYI